MKISNYLKAKNLFQQGLNFFNGGAKKNPSGIYDFSKFNKAIESYCKSLEVIEGYLDAGGKENSELIKLRGDIYYSCIETFNVILQNDLTLSEKMKNALVARSETCLKSALIDYDLLKDEIAIGETKLLAIDIFNFMGNFYNQQGEHALALECYDKTYALLPFSIGSYQADPNERIHLNNKALMKKLGDNFFDRAGQYQELNQHNVADTYYRYAIVIYGSYQEKFCPSSKEKEDIKQDIKETQGALAELPEISHFEVDEDILTTSTDSMEVDISESQATPEVQSNLGDNNMTGGHADKVLLNRTSNSMVNSFR
jgi:tetratricopeptide (TPR) repeat protein